MSFKRGFFIASIIVFLLLTQFPNSIIAKQYEPKYINSGNYGKGFRYNIKGWTYIHIEGEPYERGYQYGYLAAMEIIDILQRWANFGHDVPVMKLFIIKNLPKNYDKLTNLWWNICRSRSMRYFEKHIPNENKQEIKGIVNALNDREVEIFGRSVEYEDIVASQFVQEVWYAFFHFSSYKRFHPIRNIIYGLRDIFTGKTNHQELGHCHAIIATGDATENGEIVAAHATIFNEYIAERCNFIVDIKPSTGYRFIMTAPPGSLWSQEDYYQNEKGIILTETELVPQGPFNIRKTPKGIRSRTAIQYSASIDEIIDNLQKGNNGLIPNEWLIGDTKTGEIARLEQALYNTPVTRTKNGIFFSCCAPNNNKVEKELWGLVPKTIAINYYNNKYDNKVIDKFNELKREHYGKIDIETVKKIFATFPISQKTTDCKITSSELLGNMGLVVYFGWINGTEFIPTKKSIQTYKGITKLPSSGWLEIYDSNFNNVDLKRADIIHYKDESKLLWTYEVDNPVNDDYSDIVPNSEIIPAYNKKNGDKLWNIQSGKIKQLTISDKSLFVGTKNGIYKLKKKNGDILWRYTEGEVTSNPVLFKKTIISSFSNGHIHGFDINSGEKLWSYKFSDKPYLSENMEKIISVASGKSCYGFDLVNKDIIWEVETEKIITSSPRIDGNTVYVGSWDGHIYAIDCKTGYIKWKYQTGWAIDSTPEVSENLVFVGSLDNNFYALDKETGSLIWHFTCKSAIHTNPITYGNNVFFGCDDGRFYAINKTNGELEWSFTPGYSINNDANNYITTPIVSNPIVEDGIVYFSTKGTVYALDAQTFEDFEKPLERKTDLNMGIIIISLTILIISIIILYRVIIKNKRLVKR